MFYLILEINGYSQMKRLGSETLADLEKSVDSLLAGRGGKKQVSEQGLFIYTFKTADAKDTLRVLDAFLGLRGSLEEKAEELTGYLLYIDYAKDSASPESVLRVMRSAMRRLEMNESSFVGKDAYPHFVPFCRLEPESGMYKTAGRIENKNAKLGVANDFCVRPAVASSLARTLSRYIDCRTHPKGVFIQGDVLSGVRYTVAKALDKALGGTNYLSVHPVPGGIYQPLAGAVDFSYFEEIPGFLSSAEGLLWEQRKGALVHLRAGSRHACYSDTFHQDISSAFLLFLLASLRRSEDRLEAALILCEDVHLLHPAARRILSSAFKMFLPRHRLIPVCTGSFPLQEFESLPWEVLRLPEIGKDELSEILSQLPPELSACKPEDVLLKTTSGKIIPLYHQLLAGPGAGEPFGATESFLFQQETAVREVFYTIGLASGLLSDSLLEDFLEDFEITSAQTKDILRRLQDYGYIALEKTPRIILPELLDVLRGDGSIRKGLLDEKLSSFLYRFWREGRLHQEEHLLSIMSCAGREKLCLEIYASLLSYLLDIGENEHAAALLSTEYPAELNRNAEAADYAEVVVLSHRMRHAMAIDDREAAEEINRVLDGLVIDEKNNPYFGLYLLQKSHYALLQNDPRGALELSKRATLFFQDANNLQGIARANIEIGLDMLTMGKILEASDYFDISYSSSSTQETRFERLQASVYESIVHFVKGDFSRVLGQALKVRTDASGCGNRRWAVFSGFLEARALFELGDFNASDILLQGLLSECSAIEDNAPLPVLYRWISRCAAYRGDGDAARKRLAALDKSPETLFFLAETEYFLGNAEAALICLEEGIAGKAGDSGKADNYWGPDLNWETGFRMIEDLAVGRSGGTCVLLQSMKCFRAFLLAVSGDLTLGIEDLARLTREEKNSENDPYNRIYFYLYGAALPESSRLYEDKLTILGKAVKYLQERASRIENPSHKVAFFMKNYWNKKLMEEARLHNLV